VLEKEEKIKQVQADNVNVNVNDNDNKTKEKKEKYKDFVFLSRSEFQILKELLGEGNLEKYIEALNNYIGQKGKHYKSHYYTIRNWRKRDNETKKSLQKNENYSAENWDLST
jgi:hypothetical protein ELI_1586